MIKKTTTVLNYLAMGYNVPTVSLEVSAIVAGDFETGCPLISLQGISTPYTGAAVWQNLSAHFGLKRTEHYCRNLHTNHQTRIKY